ncbi:hypothetical protein RMSM_03709 [Rhodopirellula maiorica SM1]|uniref:Uncharacterized protein n=1 Tax=Rhodopirellula maiorica SM1 TaxID=1265738 RepID=M5RJ84_9BACT|nr:hypothetical protein RMSM_03709 [Rhodopirellula maiorica SM1]
MKKNLASLPVSSAIKRSGELFNRNNPILGIGKMLSALIVKTLAEK